MSLRINPVLEELISEIHEWEWVTLGEGGSWLFGFRPANGNVLTFYIEGRWGATQEMSLETIAEHRALIEAMRAGCVDAMRPYWEEQFGNTPPPESP